LLLGDHNLSVERLRYPVRYREAVPRVHRLCRLCRGAVEDEVHALFDCAANTRLTDLKSRFLDALSSCDPELADLYTTMTMYDFMVTLVSSKKAAPLLAKYVYQVLGVFDETPGIFP
ncbi:hypothetical protein B0H12DRAFT_974879, partial [Mycena haematopus]